MTVSANDFMNETEFENDPFAAVEEDAHVESYSTVYSALEYYVIVVTIIKLVLILAVIAVNIFLAIVIFRFKRLRAVRTNIYILNLTILNIFYYLCSPLFYAVCHIFSSYEVASTLVLQTQMTLLTLYLTFAIGLSLDWLLSAKKPFLMNKVEPYYRYIFISIYFLFFLEWTVSFIYSEIHHIARAGLFLIVYLIYLIILIILNVFKRKLNFRSQSKKTEYALSVTNVIIFSFLPIFFFHLILQMVFDNVALVLLFLEFIPAFIEIGHPIWIIHLLGKKNKYFKMAYYKSFKRSIQNYEDEDLDAVSEEEDFRSTLTTSNMQVTVNGIQEEV